MVHEPGDVLTLALLLTLGPASFAADVLPTATVCDVLLRSARRAPRAITTEGTDKLRRIVHLVTTDAVVRRRTLTDVRPAAGTDGGLLSLSDPAPESVGTVVAREYIGEDEIAAALADFDRERIEIGDAVLTELARLYPRARPAELMRLTLEVAGAGLPSFVGFAHAIEFANVPLAVATVLHNERRRQRQREERHGVPGLDRHVRILRRALRETPTSRAEGVHRALSIVRATARVTPEVHRAIAEGRVPDARDIARLVESARPLRAGWMDQLEIDPPSFEITVESAVFTEPDPRECRLRWMIFYRARRILPPPDGLVRPAPDRLRAAAGVARP